MNLPTIEIDASADVIQLNTKFKNPIPEERFLVIETRECSHFNATYIVDDTLSEVTCSKCKAKLNPMFVLKQLAQKETRWHEHFKQYQDEMKRLSERSKTKCQHCKQMTRISKS